MPIFEMLDKKNNFCKIRSAGGGWCHGIVALELNAINHCNIVKSRVKTLKVIPEEQGNTILNYFDLAYRKDSTHIIKITLQNCSKNDHGKLSLASFYFK
ncbi:hypothetical protein [Lactobacillus sp. ESL0228]|uniref:hypothetical protein n=1 Tax=Lactobacillus sp. ESL0228 TaxID=2069352 RepID=UPI000EFD0E49|nr:hypothetical protein [Lactobacillus sp. ESL0228]RMC47679.1 hypothetical protein F5ESL0228_07095 [Lactobacillus sp. ESL0228]